MKKTRAMKSFLGSLTLFACAPEQAKTAVPGTACAIEDQAKCNAEGLVIATCSNGNWVSDKAGLRCAIRPDGVITFLLEPCVGGFVGLKDARRVRSGGRPLRKA